MVLSFPYRIGNVNYALDTPTFPFPFFIREPVRDHPNTFRTGEHCENFEAHLIS